MQEEVRDDGADGKHGEQGTTHEAGGTTPPPLPPAPAGLADVLGDGTGEPVTMGLADVDGLS